jgi:hypothetical protein
VAGSKNGDGYVHVEFDGAKHKAHRIIWLWQTGQQPTGDVDHENGIVDDNRWVNLRDKTTTEVMRNQRRYKNNASGTAGVWWDRRRGKWQANIGVQGKVIRLGWFLEKDEAIAARRSAEIEHGFHPNHGREAA